MVIWEETTGGVHVMGLGSNLKFEKDEKFSMKNLTRQNFLFLNLTQCKFFISNSDKKKKVRFEIRRVVKFFIQNLTRCIFFQNLTRCKTF